MNKRKCPLSIVISTELALARLGEAQPKPGRASGEIPKLLRDASAWVGMTKGILLNLVKRFYSLPACTLVSCHNVTEKFPD